MLCFKYCKDKIEAEDLLHDVFIEIFQNIKKFNGDGSFEGWLKRIAINKTISFLKKSNKWQYSEINEFIENEENEVKSNVPFEVIMTCIQNLPPQYRLVFSLYALDDYSHKEIAI